MINKDIEIYATIEIRIYKNFLTIIDKSGFYDIIRFRMSDDLETDLAFINVKIGDYFEKLLKDKIND